MFRTCSPGCRTALAIALVVTAQAVPSAYSQSPLQVGYGIISSDGDAPLPVATALFAFRNEEGVLVTEAGVAAVQPIRRGRIFVDGQIPTGLALANPSENDLVASLTLRDGAGNRVGDAQLQLLAGQHTARFASDLFGPLGEGFIGSVTFDTGAAEGVGALTIRQGTNRHGEPLFANLPVAELGDEQAPGGNPLKIFFPQIGAGGILSTQILLINPTAETLSGEIQLTGNAGLPLELELSVRSQQPGGVVQGGPVTASKFPYQLAPNGVFQGTLTSSEEVLAGYAVVTVEEGSRVPAGTAVFQFRDTDGRLVSEAGVGAIDPTSAARIFVDTARTQTGVALVNAGNQAVNVSFDLLDRNGNPIAGQGREVPPKGHMAVFVRQLFPDLPLGFTGVLEISAPTEVVPITLKLSRNSRGDLILTTLPVADLNRLPGSGTAILPQVGFGSIPNSGEISTRLIFLNGDSANEVAVGLSLVRSDGSELVVPIGSATGSHFDWTVGAGGSRQFRPANPATAQSIIIDPFAPFFQELAIKAGGTLHLAPMVVDSDGLIRDDFDLTFASLSQEVATVDSGGKVTGVLRGFSTLTVVTGTTVATSTMTVTEVVGGQGGFGAVGIAQDQAGRIYLADRRDHTVLVASSVEESAEIYAGATSTPGLQDGARLAALFDGPAHLVLNRADGSLFVSDSGNRAIRQVHPGAGGAVETLLGLSPAAGTLAGSKPGSLFVNPQGIDLDNQGGLWVVDSGNHTIHRIDLAGEKVERIAGSPGEPGAVDGVGDQALFNSPVGIAIEGESLAEQLQRTLSGDPPPPVRVIVADTGNGLLRRIRCPVDSPCSSGAVVETVGDSSLPARAGRFPAGEGPATGGPVGVMVDPAGIIFVSYPDLGEVLLLTPDGRVAPLAQGGSFIEPTGLAQNQSGELVVVDARSSAAEIRFGAPVITTVLPSVISTTGGELVTIEGANFAPETRVFVRGLEMVDLSVENTQTIRFTAPAFPSGRTTLTVQHRGGLAQAPLVLTLPDIELAPGHIITVAGGSNFTGDGSLATEAVIAFPAGLAVDASGSVFVSDQTNRIRRIDPSTGLITSIAGSGEFGLSGDGENALGASLNLPRYLAFDQAGSLLFCDSLNDVVRKVDPGTGTISRVAGTGIRGFDGDGGPATQASFHTPRGLAVDRSGNLFIADERNHRIRKVDSISGQITTVAGVTEDGAGGLAGDEGPASEAMLFRPQGLAFDRFDNLFIADSRNSRVRRVGAASGIITTVAGDPADGVALNRPGDVAIDFDGSLLISDFGTDQVLKLDLHDGGLERVAGVGSPGFSGDDGLAIDAELNLPTSLSLDAAGNILVSDFLNSRIRTIDSLTSVITTFGGTGLATIEGDGGPATTAALYLPEEIVLDSLDNLLVADRGNSSIRIVDGVSGIIDTVAGSGVFGFSGDGGPAVEATLASPRGVAVDGTGRILIADHFNHRIRRVDEEGIMSTLAGRDRQPPPEPPDTPCPPASADDPIGDGGPAEDALLCTPGSVVVDGDGVVYFSDTGNHRIRWIDPQTGLIDTIAGTGNRGFSGDGGPAAEAMLRSPRGLALGPAGGLFAGGLYVADRNNHHVRRIDLDTLIITSVVGADDAGTPVQGFGGDGEDANRAFLDRPRGVAFDAAGSLYISDAGNSRIRRVDAQTGLISTVVGTGEQGFSGDGGPALDAVISIPSGLGIDSLGNLYFSELLNGRVRVVRAPF